MTDHYLTPTEGYYTPSGYAVDDADDTPPAGDLAAYPSFNQLLDSKRETLDDVQLDVSVSGAVRGRGFFTVPKYRFTLEHLLSTSQYSTLCALYNTNRLLRVTLTWIPDGAQYVCFFDGPPSAPDYLTPTLARVRVRLRQQ